MPLPSLPPRREQDVAGELDDVGALRLDSIGHVFCPITSRRVARGLSRRIAGGDDGQFCCRGELGRPKTVAAT